MAISWFPEPVTLSPYTAKEDFADVIKFKDLDIGRILRIIQVGPT